MTTTHAERTDSPAGEADGTRTRSRERGEVAPGHETERLEDHAGDEHPLLTVQRELGNRATQQLLGVETGLQPKLRVGRPNDRFEREAERVARSVTRGGSARPATARETTEPTTPRIQRLCPRCRRRARRGQPLDCPECERTLRRSAATGNHPPEVSDDVAGEISRARGSGRPLPPATRSFFESRLEHGFEDVRVHAGPRAARLNRALDARAFTLGRDVFFGASEYRPDSDGGKRLLAHELTHVVQQRGLDGAGAEVVQRYVTDIELEARSGGLERTTAYYQQQQQRYEQWVASHERQHPATLEGRARTMADEIRRTQQALIGARAALFRKAREQPRPGRVLQQVDLLVFDRPPALIHQELVDALGETARVERVPSDLMDRWTEAFVVVGVVPELLAPRIQPDLFRFLGDVATEFGLEEAPGPAVPERESVTGEREPKLVVTEERGPEREVTREREPEQVVTTMDTPRSAFTRFYLSLIRLAETVEAENREFDREYTAFLSQFEETRSACRRGCHQPSTARAPRRYIAPPPPRSDTFRRYLEHATAATTTWEWTGVLTQFEDATESMDDMLAGMVAPDSEELETLEQTKRVLEEREALRRRQPEAIPLPGVFYPRTEFVDQETASGASEETAAEIPWSFFLYYEGLDDEESEPTWVIEDMTSGKHFKAKKEMSAEEARQVRQGAKVDPPKSLYEELNDDLLFPRGQLYVTTPTEETQSIETTEPWSVADWFEAIGIALGVAALLLLSGGTAAPALVTGLGIGAGVASTVSVIANIAEKSEHDVLTDEDVSRAVLQIATDIVSIGAAGLGRVASVARGAGTAATGTRVGSLAGRSYLFAEAASAVGDTANLIVAGYEVVEGLERIDAMNLTDEQKRVAKARLVLTGFATGALTTVSVVGSGKSLKEFASRRPPVRLRAEPDGTFRIEAAGPSAREGAEVGPPVELADEGAFLRTTRDRDELLPTEAGREFDLAHEPSNRRRLTAEDRATGYVEAFELNGHTWKRHRKGFWCRFSSRGECFRFPPNDAPEPVEAGAAAPIRTESGRYVVEDADDVAALRRRSPERPAGLAESDADLWEQYVRYHTNRLDRIEAELEHGARQTPPPRTWESYAGRQRALQRGTGFNKAVLGSMREPGPLQSQFRTLSEVGVKPQSGPHAGELRRPDLLIEDLESGSITAVSNKSRAFQVPEGDYTETALQNVLRQVRADVDELVTKYSGRLEIRRPTHPAFGETVPVREVVLVYEQTGVPDEVARRIVREAQLRARQLDPRLDFQVTFQAQ